MFTGIIQDCGKIKNKSVKGDNIRFVVESAKKKFLKNIKKGDSISINGACMTVEWKSGSKFKFTTIKESLGKTNLSALKINDLVNLEKAMTINNKLDGHIVQGHVDTTGTVTNIGLNEGSRDFYISFSSAFRKNIITVGSIAINGVSLTIAQIAEEDDKNILIKVSIIPHTYRVTNFRKLRTGDAVNIEFDMLGKYVVRIFENDNKKTAS